MIIFDLDGTLANCEHRRHFVDPSLHDGEYIFNATHWMHVKTHERFKPNWRAFYDACDKDEPIKPTIQALRIFSQHYQIQVWSGRCESVRDKTIDWFDKHIPCFAPKAWFETNLKMRPIGDNTPDDQLKEMWLIDAMVTEGKKIDMVFDDRPKMIHMWRRRGIFVFNCCQHDEEF